MSIASAVYQLEHGAFKFELTFADKQHLLIRITPSAKTTHAAQQC